MKHAALHNIFYMNKTIKTILILSIVILISLGTYYLYSRNANGVASTIIDDDSSSYLSKINIDGIKYDSLNNSDKRVFDIFKSNLNEEYKQNGAIPPVATDSLLVLYTDTNLMLIRESSVNPCNSVKLIKKVTQEILSKNCFISEFISGQYILSIDDYQGIVVYKAGSKKIVELSSSILGNDSVLTYSSIDTYNSPDPVKSKSNFTIASNTLTIDTYKRLGNSFVKKVSFELP